MKTCLITGASEGIGRAMVKKWIAEGFKVTGIARNEARLKELKNEYGEAFDYVVCDLAADANKIVRLVEKQHFDVFINNAGFGIYSRFVDQPIEKVHELLDLNIKALVTLSHAYLKTAKSGDALMNVSSMLAFLPMPTGAVYAASKAFVTSFTESLWQQHQVDGIYVFGLCPGSTESEFFKRANQADAKPPPNGIKQTAEQVADIAWNAVQDRSAPTVMCGAKNKALVLATRLLSRRGLVSIMSKVR